MATTSTDTNAAKASSEGDGTAETVIAPSGVTAADAPKEKEGVLWTGAPAVSVAPEESDSVKAAQKAAREEEALRLANPNKVVYRAPSEDIGGQSFDVGFVADEKK